MDNEFLSYCYEQLVYMHKNNNKKVYTKEKDSNYDDNLYVTPNIGINFIYQT